MNKEIEIIFIESAVRYTERFYCNKCFYGSNKELLHQYPKPVDTKCNIGRDGYYKGVVKNG